MVLAESGILYHATIWLSNYTFRDYSYYRGDYQKRRKDDTKKDVQYSIIYNPKSSRMGINIFRGRAKVNNAHGINLGKNGNTRIS